MKKNFRITQKFPGTQKELQRIVQDFVIAKTAMPKDVGRKSFTFSQAVL